MEKPRVSTVFLAGCFGCHMSLLDIDERLETLLELVDLGPSPLTDEKAPSGRYRVGFIEGGCANEEDVRRLRELRSHCDVLIACGECAIQGDIPSLRNNIPLRECLEEAYLKTPSTYNPSGVLPRAPELPWLLDRVHPCSDVVTIDYMLPGCPPSADAIWQTLNAALAGEPVQYPYSLLKYD